MRSAEGLVPVARCAVHPDRPAVGTCERCGRFACAADLRVLGSRQFCETCAARPDVDYLEATRLRFWGQRDVWAWLVLLGGVGQLLSGISVLAAVLLRANSAPSGFRLALPAVLMLGFGVLSGAYWLGRRWARTALLVVQLLLAGLFMVAQLFAGDPDEYPLMLFTVAIPGGFALAIWYDTRNRLFFRVPVSRQRLHRLWAIHSDNPVARAGYLLSLLSIFAGPLAVVSIPLCLVGLRRVNPQAHPPQGRKGQAIAGLVLSTAGLGIFIVLVVG